MARLGDYLSRQGRFVLEQESYALLYIAVFALVPYATWLSAALVALLTLRKGALGGLKGLVVACLAHFCLALLSISFSAALASTIMAFLPCYLTAAVLHETVSWRITVLFIVLLALMAIVLVHWLAPDFIMDQFHYLQTVIKSIEQDGSDNSLSLVLNDHNLLNQVAMANYLVGVQAISLILSAIASLMLARSIQSRLFYPGGFKQEMLGFRASGYAVILLVIVALGAYQHNALAMACLPVIVCYFFIAGIVLGFNLITKGKGKGGVMLFLLLLPIVFVPSVMLPVYAILGALDSLFNFRLRLHFFAAGTENKG